MLFGLQRMACASASHRAGSLDGLATSCHALAKACPERPLGVEGTPPGLAGTEFPPPKRTEHTEGVCFGGDSSNTSSSQRQRACPGGAWVGAGVIPAVEGRGARISFAVVTLAAIRQQASRKLNIPLS